jgi:hypothetical protein
MILGIVWLFWIGSLLAVIFGIVALFQIKRSNGWITGKGFAIAGLVLGLVGMVTLTLVAIPFALGASQRARDDQAKVAQSTLRNALVAAKVAYSDTGSFENVTLAKLNEIEPSIYFQGADQPSTAAHMVSVTAVGDQFAAAALDPSGKCWWITEELGSFTRYGHGEPCTATAALTAAGSTWSGG